MARNKEYERSPIRGSSTYQHKEDGCLIRDRNHHNDMMVVVERLFGGHYVRVLCAEKGYKYKLASWYVDYECEKI